VILPARDGNPHSCHQHFFIAASQVLPVAIFGLSSQISSGTNKRADTSGSPVRYPLVTGRISFEARVPRVLYSFLTPMITLRVFVLAVPLVVGFFLLRDLVREFARPKR
jgi:hypothetical protein